MDLVKRLDTLGSSSGKPRSPVGITDCGEITTASASAALAAAAGSARHGTTRPREETPAAGGGLKRSKYDSIAVAAREGPGAGWEAVVDVDGSGYTYYIHADSGDTAWSLPEYVDGCRTTRQTVVIGDDSRGLVTKGSRVTLHATGKIAATGHQFWCTKDKNKPFSFSAGVGEVIVGWDLGCIGMKVGETRVLIIPGGEGYGEEGFPAWKIPPHATLHFTLECITVKPSSLTWGEGLAGPG